MKKEKSAPGLSVTHIDIRQSISFLLLRLILLDIVAALLIVIFFSALASQNIPEDIRLLIFSSNRLYFFLLVFIKICVTLFVVLQWLNEYYEIRPNAIIYRKGLLFRKEEKYSVNHIKLVGMQQGLFGKLLNFGTIELYDWDLEKYKTLYLIHNPMKYMRVLEELLPAVDVDKATIRGTFVESE